jgi:hypothetical protein
MKSCKVFFFVDFFQSFSCVYLILLLLIKYKINSKKKLLNVIGSMIHAMRSHIFIYIYFLNFKFNIWFSLTIFLVFFRINNYQFI